MKGKLPEPIKTEFDTNEGFTFTRRDDRILEDVVKAVNAIIEYLKELPDERADGL